MSFADGKCDESVQFGWDYTRCGAPSERFFATTDKDGKFAVFRSPLGGHATDLVTVRCERCFEQSKKIPQKISEGHMREVTREEAVVLVVLLT